MPQRSSAFVPSAPTVTGNATFANFIYESIGHEVLLETKSGERVTGVLAGVSNERDVGLYSASYLPKDQNDEHLPKKAELNSKLKFAGSAWVSLSRVLSEEKSIKEFATDTEYHEQKKQANGDHLGDFEEWHDDENGGEEVGAIEEATGGGWAVDDMFQQNGTRVKSDFCDNLSQYMTVEIAEDTEEKRREADKIARAIEASAGSRRMQLLENDDEERDLDKLTEFEREQEFAAANSGRRGARHPRGNAAAPRGGATRGRGGRQFNTSGQNFAPPQFNPRGNFQSRGGSTTPRYGASQNGNAASGGESWRQAGPRRSVEAPAVGSYSAVVAGGMKTGAAASNDVRMSSGNAPPSRFVETGASAAAEKERPQRNQRQAARTEDLRTWGTNFDKAYNQPEAAQTPPAVPRPGNAWQSGPPHRGKTTPQKPAEEPQPKPEEKKEEVVVVEKKEEPPVEVEKPQPEEAPQPVDAAEAATEVASSEAPSEEKAEKKSTFKFNPNAPAFTPKTTVPQTPTTILPVMHMPMMPPAPPATSGFPQMVVGYNTQQSYGAPAVLYPPGQVYAVQQYVPQTQPQPSGTQTPNGSGSGNAAQQQPPRSRQQSAVYAAPFQQGMPQQPVYAQYPQQVYQAMPIYPYQQQPGYHSIVAGQPVTSSAGQGFQPAYPVHQQPAAAAMPQVPHPGAYGHVQQPYHPQNTSESQCSTVAESQAQSTNGSTSSSTGCQRSKPTTPQPLPQQQQQVNGSGVASSATSGYNTPQPAPQPLTHQQPMYPMHPQNAPSMPYSVMYPGHQIFQIPPHQNQYLQYQQQPRNSSFPPQNVMYAPQQAPQGPQMQNS